MELIKDLANIAGVLVASYVGLAGLSAWRKQLLGHTDYELARKYLKSVYQLREAIKHVRNPFIPVEEMVVALKESGLDPEKDFDDKRKNNGAVYQQRWNKINDAKIELNLNLLEAEVLWGVEARVVYKDLEMNTRKLFASLKLYVDGHPLKEDRDIIYDLGESDPFNKEIDKSVKKIEDYLRPHLK